ncbi:Aste57867_21693 [Aphanomyces stellatus]|uniref:Aste57867_21693 protein n=1 Tax=Aphanomyces stellatus TaxID=120398 RepID=A0A485LI63_9STRA|nr:hypothetical protein As57867_021624 [Aphanomyces stellatus]VFT98362.1 Aste57867_21693 [Aphanomyces stellatus]
MMGSPRPAGLDMTLEQMDDVNRGGPPSSSGKIRQYPKHRAQHMASAAPYSSPRTPFGWTQHNDEGRYLPTRAVVDGSAVAPPPTTGMHGMMMPQQPTREVGRRVYVGNLSWEVKWMNLKDHMRQAGEVDHCDVLVEASGRSKGCGLVTYRTAEMAREAIRTLTDTELLGRKIFVREDREEGAPPRNSSFGHHHAGPPPGHHGGGGAPTGPATTSRVYVSNLSWSVKWQELKDFMKRAGNVMHADVLEEPGGRSKGCGIVEYDSPEAAERAIQMLNDTQFGDRKIFIREDRETRGLGRPPSGFRGPPRGGALPPPSAGYGAYDQQPPPSRGYDHPPSRGYDPPSRGYDPPSRGYDPPPRAYDNAPRGGYDEPPRGYDPYDPPHRPYDHGAPPTLPRGYDAYDPPQAGHRAAPVAPSPYDPPSRGYDTAPRYDQQLPPPRATNAYPPQGPPPGPAAPGTKLFVGNIPFDASWQDVKDLFRSVANVDHVDMMTTADGRSKGYALVQCSSLQDAQAAIGRLHDTDFRGRYLEVRLDRPRFG